MSFLKEKPALKAYVIIVVSAAILFLMFNSPELELLRGGYLFFIFLHIVLEHMVVPLPRGHGFVSVGFATSLAMIILFGPAAAAWGNFATILYVRDLKEFRNRFHKNIFNAAQLAISTGIAGYAYLLTGGSIGRITLPEDLLPILAAVFTYFIMNATLVLVVISLAQGISFLGAWLINFRWSVPNYMAVSPLGILIAVVYRNMGIAGVLLLTIPLMLARHTFALYMDMRNQYLSTIKALTMAIDAKDHYTHGHSERVARYSVMIGREMNLTEDFLEKLEYLALMHDIGKISIPEQILNKPSRLSDDEFNLIRSHSAVGAEIISNIGLIGDLADIVRHHHERVDGRGYPDGLSGDKMSLGAKIVGVADAFDAMTSVRVYRTPFTKEEAVEEMKRCCNSQFCQAVVNAFIRALRRSGEIS